MKIPVARPDISDLERIYANNAIDSNWISSGGYFSEKFEKDFSNKIGLNYCSLVSNGTVALHLALLAVGVEENDEVIVPSLTYVASVNCIRYLGATPVFIDINISDWGLNVELVEKAISKKTKAVIAVHLYGKPCLIDELRLICDKYGIYLIEDVAEAPTGKLKNRNLGSFGHVSTYSFFGNKIISSGEGGCLVTNDSSILNRINLLKNQGVDPLNRYNFKEIGYNYRLTNISAAILVAQLERLEEMLQRRFDLFNNYKSIINNYDFFEIIEEDDDKVISPWLFSVTFRTNSNFRDRLIAKLNEIGIETRPFFIPVHLLKPYTLLNNKKIYSQLSNSISISERGISLPTSSAFSKNEIDYILSNLEKILKKL